MFHPNADALRAQFEFLVPEMLLVAVACVLFLGGTFLTDRRTWNFVALAGLLVALVTLFALPHRQALAGDAIFGVPFVFDGLATLTRALAFAGGILLLLVSWEEVPEKQIPDHQACLLLIVAGTGLIGAANDLAALFLALELVSIPTYILLYLPRHDDASQEASIKYFLLSIFSSALLLFGFSYLFGLTGTTNIAAALQVVYGADPGETALTAGLAQIALVTIVAGLGFRITAVPFHFYAPDVYQGVAASSAALLALIPKIAGFVALVRVFGFVLPEGVAPRAGTILGMGLSEQAPILLWFLAAITMTVGNLLALLQDNLKRLLAYSSVAHAGYMLVALASAPYVTDGVEGGVPALLYYLMAYGAMTVGAFAVIAMLHAPARPVETVDDLAGLSRTHPGLALMLAVLMFSFIGIPLTAGFTGKFLIFFGAVSVDRLAYLYYLLALIGFLNAAVGGWYYLRIVAVMYLRPFVLPILQRGTVAGRTALALCVLLTLGLSIPPGLNWVLGATRRAAPGEAPANVQQARANPQ
jgi:NADH-quinone oxidoreductase subunit N